VAIATRNTGKVVQAWVSPQLEAALKQTAERERRSVSAVVRNAVEDAVTRPREDRP
jgi:predicted transcriptional regulator